jgi:predicted glycogen debranching enzyme
MDAPLWFFWALQQYTERSGDKQAVWKAYGEAMRDILNAYRDGTDYGIQMQQDGLLSGGSPGKALTWMNAYVDGRPVTPRHGLAVEVNALWYNAVCFTLEIAGPRSIVGKEVLNEWKHMPEKMATSFIKTFWDADKAYLADVVEGSDKDWSVRPNQLLAVSLPYSPVDEDMREAILKKIEKELLTPRGLRSLSPEDPAYRPFYKGTLEQRHQSMHQGCTWPWLMGHYVEASIKAGGRDVLEQMLELYRGFEPCMTEHGLSTISEIYEGDAPFKARGAISQAWNVAELIRCRQLISDYDKATKPVSL